MGLNIFSFLATVSEYQRFLSRLIMHKTLRTEQSFITFLTGTVEVSVLLTIVMS